MLTAKSPPNHRGLRASERHDMVSCHSARMPPPGGGNTGDMHDICSFTVHSHHYSVMSLPPSRVHTPWSMGYGSPKSLEQLPATKFRHWKGPQDTGLLAMSVV